MSWNRQGNFFKKTTLLSINERYSLHHRRQERSTWPYYLRSAECCNIYSCTCYAGDRQPWICLNNPQALSCVWGNRIPVEALSLCPSFPALECPDLAFGVEPLSTCSWMFLRPHRGIAFKEPRGSFDPSVTTFFPEPNAGGRGYFCILPRLHCAESRNGILDRQRMANGE